MIFDHALIVLVFGALVPALLLAGAYELGRSHGETDAAVVWTIRAELAVAELERQEKLQRSKRTVLPRRERARDFLLEESIPLNVDPIEEALIERADFIALMRTHGVEENRHG